MNEKKEESPYATCATDSTRVGLRDDIPPGQWQSVVEGFGFHTYLILKDGAVVEYSKWKPSLGVVQGNEPVDASILHKPTVELMIRLRRVSLGMQKVKLLNAIGKAADTPVQPTKEECVSELERRRRESAFKPGDVVYYKLHFQTSIAVRSHGSLHSPWVMTVHKSLGGGYFETKRWHSDHGFIDGVFHADELVKLPPPAAKE